MKKLSKKIILLLAPYLAYLIIKVLKYTMRFSFLNAESIKEFHNKNQPIVMAFWHGRLLMMPVVYKGRGISILISMHSDGELISRAMNLFGFSSVRGSTTRGGTKALRDMANVIKRGTDIAITPDGPKGPRCVAQNGAVMLAKITGAPICPVTYSAVKKKHLSSWDRFMIPFPFSKGVFIWGEPIFVNGDANKDELEKKRVELENALNEITKKADEYYSLT